MCWAGLAKAFPSDNENYAALLQEAKEKRTHLFPGGAAPEPTEAEAEPDPDNEEGTDTAAPVRTRPIWTSLTTQSQLQRSTMTSSTAS